MCLSPSNIRLPNGRSQEVGCRKCRICIDNVTKDWVGRCLAEKRVSGYTASVTLTYGRDDEGNVNHERAAVLTYSDMQKYFKRVRKNVGPIRYLLAGEYGSQKGRAHWHGIFFFRNAVPKHKLFERFNEELWPHGHQLWKKPEPSHVKYCCKYIRKDEEQGHQQNQFVTSKNPPIGALYFVDRAVRMARAGLPLRDLFYSFGEAKKKDGSPVQFYLRGATADLYRQSYMTAWRAIWGISPLWPACLAANDPQPTDALMEYVDRNTREQAEIDDAMPWAEIDGLVKELAIWQERAKAGLPKYAELLDDYYLRQKPGWNQWIQEQEK